MNVLQIQTEDRALFILPSSSIYLSIWGKKKMKWLEHWHQSNLLMELDWIAYMVKAPLHDRINHYYFKRLFTHIVRH